MQSFIHGIRQLPMVDLAQTTFWTFTNVALLVLFAIIGVVLFRYIIMFKIKSSHPFCLEKKKQKKKNKKKKTG